jgi:hypothetical protein
VCGFAALPPNKIFHTSARPSSSAVTAFFRKDEMLLALLADTLGQASAAAGSRRMRKA